MTCCRQIQAGWPGCRKDVGDRISLQQTMGVMRGDSVKPVLWRPEERAMLAILNKCSLKTEGGGSVWDFGLSGSTNVFKLLCNRGNIEVSNLNFPPAVKGMSLMQKKWKFNFDFIVIILLQKNAFKKYSATKT